jgi:hypothetical protein
MKYDVVRQGCLLRTKEWLKQLGLAFCLVFLLAPVRGGDSADKADKKVTVCHKGNAIEISENALSAHLAHGDTEGPCQITPSKNK